VKLDFAREVGAIEGVSARKSIAQLKKLQLGDLGEHRKVPQRVRGGAPAANNFGAYIAMKFVLKSDTILVHFSAKVRFRYFGIGL
jgi:hypothetical protein